MKVNCVNSMIVITHPSGFVAEHNRKDYEESIEHGRKMLDRVQSNISEAERMIKLIDDSVTSKTTG